MNAHEKMIKKDLENVRSELVERGMKSLTAEEVNDMVMEPWLQIRREMEESA